MKIECDCGKELEDTEKKISLGSQAYYIDTESEYGVIGKEYSLFACNYCGAQALIRKLEDDECYEI